MNLKKPKFWDYKTPNIFAYLIYPISLTIILINFIFNRPSKKKFKIKNIGEKILKKTIKELDNLIKNEFKKT